MALLTSSFGPPSPLHPSGSPYPSGPTKCSVDHGKSGELNPLNQVPSLVQKPAPGQTTELPLAQNVK